MDLRYWKSVEADDLFRAVADEENLTFVLETLKAMTPDPVWTKGIIKQIESKRIETRCFVAWLARELRPRTYLEIGVRRGFSMAMVAARCREVEIYGFDMWVSGYAGVDNPGPEFVQSQLEQIGYTKQAHFLSGNSHRTLPAFFGNRKAPLRDRLRLSLESRRRPATFDLITVDGDHSLLGAWQDLVDVMPYCSVGGAVVFDDTAPDTAAVDPVAIRHERGEDPHGWRDLSGVWRAIQEQFRDFRYFEYSQNPPGVGLAVRVS